MYIHVEGPKKICSQCGSGQFHTWNESYSDLMGTSTTYNHWIQCNLCNHRSILATTKMTTSCKTFQYIQLPKLEQFKEF
mgnify:CR=1 FL=1